MKVLVAGGTAVLTGAALAVWLFFGSGHAADSGDAGPPSSTAVTTADRLVVHEWGTFTSFSGSDGVPVRFRPNNTDLPDFIYSTDNPGAKAARLAHDGLVSMETPVLYFYANRDMRASARVDFPRGWITEWYPFAATAPVADDPAQKSRGQSIRWDVKLTSEQARLPRDEGKNPYYYARETDAVQLQAEVTAPADGRDRSLRGGSVVQREKFLFYRGVGTFPPPLTVQALGQGKVRVKNSAGGSAEGMVLVSVRGGRVSFQALGTLANGTEALTNLPAVDGQPAELAALLVNALTSAGLYEKEARAMVKTWDSAWFGEEGTRLLYMVPRPRTDELLPLTIEPKPAEVVRVLVGRHDFLTPEQEVSTEQLVRRERAAQAELQAVEKGFLQIGRFAEEARRRAEKRLGPTPARTEQPVARGSVP